MYESAIQEAVEAGSIVIVSAGNDNTLTSDHFPAGYSNTIAVGAFEASGEKAGFSNYGSKLDISAPGQFILSTGALLSEEEQSVEYSSIYMSGTSMAAPYVSGALALLEAQYRKNGHDMNLADVQNLLANGHLTDDAGDPGKDDDFGWETLNIGKAIEYLASTSDELIVPPVLEIPQPRIDFYSILTSSQTTLKTSEMVNWKLQK